MFAGGFLATRGEAAGSLAGDANASCTGPRAMTSTPFGTAGVPASLTGTVSWLKEPSYGYRHKLVITAIPASLERWSNTETSLKNGDGCVHPSAKGPRCNGSAPICPGQVCFRGLAFIERLFQCNASELQRIA